MWNRTEQAEGVSLPQAPTVFPNLPVLPDQTIRATQYILGYKELGFHELMEAQEAHLGRFCDEGVERGIHCSSDWPEDSSQGPT